MGLVSSVFSRFRKTKITTKEKLEKIDEDIESIQTLLKRTREKQRSSVVFLLGISISLYLLCAIVFYLFYMPKHWMDRLFFLVPFLMFPVIIVGLKKALHYIFVTRITKNSQQLEDLKKEKQKILENVMETETYKVAKEILEKFDPNRKLVEKNDVKKEQCTPQANGMEIRKRNTMQPVGSQPRQMTPRPQIQSPGLHFNNGGGQFPPRMPQNQFQGTPQFRGPQGGMPRPSTPAPILPRDRGFVDKVAEYFVGDGPSNRYALICRQCAGHNGMALAEEFMFITYKCCYCGFVNPARKQRQFAPKLEQPKLQRESSSSPSLNSTVDDEDNKEITKSGEISKNEENSKSEENTEDEKSSDCSKDDSKEALELENRSDSVQDEENEK